MLAILLAATLAAAPAMDTVFTADGGRLRGSVVEEGANGVTIQLPDGTTRTLAPGQVTRVEYSDGTVSTPKPPAPPPAPPPAQAAPQAAPPPATSDLDTLFFADGGRARGVVIEETAGGGVTARMADGTTRRYAPGQVTRIEYSDGTVSQPSGPPRPQAAQPPAYPPPRAYPPAYPPPPPGWQQPSAPPPSTRRGHPPISPFYLTLGLGVAGFDGDAQSAYGMDQFVAKPQFDMYWEAGLRLSPAISLGWYVDSTFGDVGTDPQFSTICSASGLDCGSMTVKTGILLRHTWDPAGDVAPWLAIGTGFEGAEVWANDGMYTDSIWYNGWEMFRLMGGIDLRSNQVIGIGLYASVSWGTFYEWENATGWYNVASSQQTVHTSFTAGLRFTLFP
jgi:outer membrane protein